MQSFNSDGVSIAYVDEGEGEPILLIHGFASNIAANWRDAGWIRALAEAGRRVIAFDNRGHGQSEKLYDPSRYGAPSMAEDARRLLDHLGIARADVMGYSMGARIATFLMLQHQERVRSAILAGVGINLVRGMVGTGPIAKALEAPRSRGRDQRYGAELPGVCRKDGKRSQGPCRLHAWPAREDHTGGSCPHSRPRSRSDRQRGCDRGLRAGPCKPNPRRPTP